MKDIKIFIQDKNRTKNANIIDDILKTLSKSKNLDLNRSKRIDGQYHIYILIDATIEDVNNARKITPYSCIYAISDKNLTECDHLYTRSSFKSEYVLDCIKDIRNHRRKFKKVIEKLNTLKKCQQNLMQSIDCADISSTAVIV